MTESDRDRVAATGAGNRRERFLRESVRRRTGLLQDMWGFLAANRKWWLLPILAVLLLFGLLLILGGTAAGPFIYPLF